MVGQATKRLSHSVKNTLRGEERAREGRGLQTRILEDKRQVLTGLFAIERNLKSKSHSLGTLLQNPFRFNSTSKLNVL